MSGKQTVIALVFLAALAVIGNESAISIHPGCVIRVEEIPFRLYHWGRGWKNGTAQNPGNVSFPGEGGTLRNGTFQEEEHPVPLSLRKLAERLEP